MPDHPRTTITNNYAHRINPRQPNAISPSDPLYRPHMTPVSPTYYDARGLDKNTNRNIPDRFELFLLGEDEKKVIERVDTRVPNCSYFDFKKEDHTLGNLLCVYVGKNPAVEFNGYRVPHPLVS